MKRTNYSRTRRASLRLLCVSVIFGFGCNVALGQTVGSNEGGTVPHPVPEFPANNWWNTDISKAPVDPGSANFIKHINNGKPRHLHPDFGGNADPQYSYFQYGIYGFPYVVVDGVTGVGKSPPPLQAVNFYYSSESDGVDHSTDTAFPFYPIPPEATTTPHWVECGDPATMDERGDCDRHLLIIDRDHKYLYELWNVWYDQAHSQWNAGSGAFFDMTKNVRRPSGWTSADAAGLAIFPGLVRYDEVFNTDGTNVTEIKHAFRVTVRDSNGFVYPGSHKAGHATGALPMGTRLRLKAGVDISGYPAAMQKIFKAMKTYGLIVADNGTDMYISGTYDTRWNNGSLNPAFNGLTASNFDVIQLGWKPPLSAITATPEPALGGNDMAGKVTLLAAAPTGGAVVTLSASGTVTLPPSVTVPAGATTASFTITTPVVTAIKNPIITGSYSGGIQHETLAIEPPPVLHGFTVNPLTVASAGTATGTVVLNEAAPGAAIKVTLLSSDTTAATVPASISVPLGATSASFTVTAKNVTAQKTVTISATYSGVTKNVVVTVKPPG
ncbi:MAG TPA: hypothetical protein VGH80_13985 [Xanthomonadaceae bacterium]|jgi:hypothetical protein